MVRTSIVANPACTATVRTAAVIGLGSGMSAMNRPASSCSVFIELAMVRFVGLVRSGFWERKQADVFDPGLDKHIHGFQHQVVFDFLVRGNNDRLLWLVSLFGTDYFCQFFATDRARVA